MKDQNTPSTPTYTLETAIDHLKERGEIASDYTPEQFRTSVRTWSFASHVFARFFHLVGEDRFVPIA